MVLARVVSLASRSWLWSLLVSEEVAASPSLVLSLFPFMLLVGGCMVLQEVGVSQNYQMFFRTLYVFSSVVQVDFARI